MRIIMAAQANGFGPVSKLVAIAKLLSGAERLFVGDGTSLMFARRNSHCFDRILPYEPATTPAIQRVMLDSDLGLLVMHHQMAFRLASLRLPYYFFDSLFGFWIVRTDIPALVAAAQCVRESPPGPALELFESFSVHEQKLISHLMARRSFVQNFAGIPERVELLARHGVNHIQLIGPIIDLEPSHEESHAQAETGRAAGAAKQGGWQMLLNLCGVKNYILDFNQNDYYVDVFERWGRDFLRARPDCREILLCCGRYAEPRVELIGDGRLRCQLLPHDEFIRAVRRADVILSSPGLTSINETLHLNRLPLLLMEQHYSQYYNLVALRGTALGGLSLGNGDLFENYRVPAHDYLGSETIIGYTKRLHDSEQLYEKFRALLNERVERVLNLTEEGRRQMIVEARRMLEGSSLPDAVQEVLADFRQYQSGIHA